MDTSRVDASLLTALDVLLTEQSVTRAAGRMHTSPAAMSRTLSRLRRVLGDPLLVRAGQQMVPTPRALALQSDVAEVVRRCSLLLTPGATADPATLRTTFTIQAGDLATAFMAPELTRLAACEAPGVSIRFLAEELEDGPALRDGRIDLEVGVLDHVDPETETEDLTTLEMVAVVRRGHDLIGGGPSPAEFADALHVTVSRTGRFRGPVDSALSELGLSRRVIAVLPSHLAAMTLVAGSDLVCTIPLQMAVAKARHLRDLTTSMGLVALEVPLRIPLVVVGMAWHPRHSADGGHKWLRSAVRRVLSAEPH